MRLTPLRPSAFELKIAGALVLAAVVPLVAALWLARTLTLENLAVALNPRVVARLEATPALYGDLFQARKQLYGEQARAILRDLPRDPAALGKALKTAVREIQVELERASAQARYDVLTAAHSSGVPLRKTIVLRSGIGAFSGLMLALFLAGVLELRRLLARRARQQPGLGADAAGGVRPWLTRPSLTDLSR
jgi:hypothetical protein